MNAGFYSRPRADGTDQRQRLPPQIERRILALKGQATIREIAKRLGVSEWSVKRRIGRQQGFRAD